MAEELQQAGVAEATAPAQNTVVEENVQAPETTQPSTEQATQSENVVENSNQEVETNQQQEPTLEELKSKLKEYEVRDEEDRALRERLGIKDVDHRTYEFMNADQQIVNAGKQEYLKLCNEYGVDANPDKLDASVEALKGTDPAKAYEFQRRFEALSNNIAGKRQAVQQENAMYEVTKFSQDYNQLLSASPAMNNILTQYVQTYNPSMGGDVYGQLKGVVDIILPAYQEAFEAGKRFALQDKAKTDTSHVQGGVAVQGQTTYTSGTTFTRDQIAHMSSDEFAKYEKEIYQQMREGKIQ